MASSTSSNVVSRGVYNGLPTYPESTKGLTAIVAGANGISGQYMLKVLTQSPERWTKIYALSRRPPTGVDAPQIEHLALDFLSGVESIAAKVKEKNIRADYIFFFAYKEASDESGELWAGQDQMVKENGISQRVNESRLLG
jgi:aspartate-semialdehyde dehydrogenase